VFGANLSRVPICPDKLSPWTNWHLTSARVHAIDRVVVFVENFGCREYASALSFVFLRSEMYVSRFTHRLLKLSDYLLSTDY